MRRPQYDAKWPIMIKQLHAHDLEEMWGPELRPCAYRWYQRRLKVLIDIIEQNLPRSAHILEIGCAQATLGILLAERRYSVEPFGVGHRIFRTNPPCAGCMLETCVEKASACLTSIPAEDVAAAAAQVLSAATPRQVAIV